MEGQLASWFVSLVAGGACGNIAGALFKDQDLGPLGNTVTGVVGGVLGGQLLTTILSSGEPSSISGNVGASGVGGIAIMLIVGFFKNVRAKK